MIDGARQVIDMPSEPQDLTPESVSVWLDDYIMPVLQNGFENLTDIPCLKDIIKNRKGKSGIRSLSDDCVQLDVIRTRLQKTL